MSDEKSETTPAGSYRIAGQDVSGYLGVDPEYMNSSDQTQEAMLTEEERYLFLPAPDDEDDEVEAGEEESNSEDANLVDDGAEDHEDDDERKTYNEPVADHPTDSSGDASKETPSGDVETLSLKRPTP